MELKKRISFIAVTVLLLLTCSCTKGGSNLEVSPSNKTLVELTSKVYDDAQLTEIAGFEGRMDELNEQYPVECLRKQSEWIGEKPDWTNENDTACHVSYLGYECVAVLIFDDVGNKTYGKVYSAKKLKADFDRLGIGQSVDDVMAFDPDGEYPFLYTSSGAPFLSVHCTKDGYGIYIEYDVSWNIANKYEELL